MTALLFTGETAGRFERSDLSSGHDEKWLRDVLFSQPDLVPMDQIEPGASRFIPVTCQLGIAAAGRSLSLDIFGITPAGRPVLIECKLWRNPQARREVVAQILEYAALLRRWSLADLTARLKAKLGWDGPNPLYEHAQRYGATLNETVFSDAVARNLRNGEFHLIIAGDGIREDLSALVEHLGDRGARLALVEFQRWQDASGNRLIVPSLFFRTEVFRQRILVDEQGSVVRLEEEEAPGLPSIENGSASREANRAFWQDFIDRVRFVHPDQPPPRHGGNNWVKIPLPAPARWLTAYRQDGRAGIFLAGQPGAGLLRELAVDSEELQAEFGPEPLRFHGRNDLGVPALVAEQPEVAGDEMEWLMDASNRLVNLLRPRLQKASRDVS